MRMYPSTSECAAFFEMSEDTIERRIKSETGLTFEAFRDRHMVKVRYRLIRMAIKKAEESDTMHIFCLKKLCGWDDNRKIILDGKEVTIDDIVLELTSRLAEMRKSDANE